ncbi:MAG: hypothetical protein C3F13_17175 [Anaerolineales bacterium]|nr:CSLREA domain-containing protein [Anaerolineae bacterium]PWB50199.1 MAG: hypothetical protein C3F13_17175 [Anaerolineales bacterium]
MNNQSLKMLVSLVCVMILSLSTLSPASAATITVDTLVDENDGSCSDGDCSLRDAIQLATPVDTINFSVKGTILLNSQLSINKRISISGPGWNQLTISGHQFTRVINVTALGYLTISSVMITGGKESGGGIYNAGIVEGTGLVIVYNQNLTGHGGGINNQGVMTLISTAISDNSAYNDGGGIYNQGTLDVQRSTFYSNDARYGGGLKNEGGTVTLTNCTFYENSAASRGGGLDSGAGSTLTVINSTFYNNKGGGGLGNPDSITTVINTIVAFNTGGDCKFGDEFTEVSNHNLSTDTSCAPGFEQVTAEALRLTWGGFPVSLGLGSVAIDTGNNAGCPLIDQMGTIRPQDGNLDSVATCDIGSDELIVFGSYIPQARK